LIEGKVNLGRRCSKYKKKRTTILELVNYLGKLLQRMQMFERQFSISILTLACFFHGTLYSQSKFSENKKTDLSQDTTQSSFIDDTHLMVDGRLRYEYGDFGNRDASDAFTLRNRIGVETGKQQGFQFLVELEHTWDLLGGDHYNPYPGPGKTIIADPANFELNRLQFLYQDSDSDLSFVVGRQRITLDDQRFIGAVGWRQNEQTFDSVRFSKSVTDDILFDYAYLWQVNRIFGRDAPSDTLKAFDSDSHLFNVRFKGLQAGTLVAFAYLLDFENAAASSGQTYGLRWDGRSPMGETTEFVYDLQWAAQRDYGKNPADYSAQFYRVEAGLDWEKSCQLIFGYEVLGEDNGSAFQAPLGTNHKFNGYADAFLTTPSSGLQDLYCRIGGSFGGGVTATAAYHYFTADNGSEDFGDEFDFTLSRKIYAAASALMKMAFLNGQGPQTDITRLSIEIDYHF
jgi:hypothetical protein